MTSFGYTGALQNYVVPAGVTIVRISCTGAKGSGPNGGKGANIAGYFSVTAGEVLGVAVGGRRTTGTGTAYNGGGNGEQVARMPIGSDTATAGGGGTHVQRGSSRLIVGGGGGGSSLALAGGAGGYPTGAAGANGSGSNNGGKGGTATAGGTGGVSQSSGGNGAGGAAVNGGGGALASGSNPAGAGGGGGWYGGGGGGRGLFVETGGSQGGGGGGGSSRISGGTLISAQSPAQASGTGVGSATIDPYVTPVPSLVSPAASAIINTAAVTVTATGTSHPLTGGRVALEVQLASNSSFTSNLVTATTPLGTGTSMSATLITGFQGVAYYRVRQIGDAGLPNSAWSGARAFTISHPPVASIVHPLAGKGVAYNGGAVSVLFKGTDSNPTDKITGYRVQVWESETATDATVDTGLVSIADTGLNANIPLVLTIPPALKASGTVLWRVQVRDKQNVLSAWTPKTSIIMDDAADLSFNEPSDGSVATSGSPRIDVSASLLFGTNYARPIRSIRVEIRNSATNAVVYDKTQLYADNSIPPSMSASFVDEAVSNILQDDQSYTITATATDAIGISGTEYASFTAEFVTPDSVRYTVDDSQSDTLGHVTVDWSEAMPDDEFISWNVYRKELPSGDWILQDTIEDSLTLNYKDYMFRPGKSYMYSVTQTASRFGTNVESPVGFYYPAGGASTVVNLHTNPSFESDDIPEGTTRISEWSYRGGSALRVHFGESAGWAATSWGVAPWGV